MNTYLYTEVMMLQTMLWLSHPPWLRAGRVKMTPKHHINSTNQNFSIDFSHRRYKTE